MTCTISRLSPVARTLALLTSALLLGSAAQAATCYVNASANGANTGADWANAYTSLQSALTSAACTGTGTEIWVAKGVYKPTASTSDRNAAFHILKDMQVYGGFAGTEANRTERNPRTHVTVLSGDIDGNDANSATTNVNATWEDIRGGNSYHVVVMGGINFGSGNAVISASTVLDGFTITGGQADGPGYIAEFGGGLLCNGAGDGKACSPTLAQLAFRGNSAYRGGGAIYNDGQHGASSPSISQSSFSGNSSAGDGGAIYNNGRYGTSSPSISQTSFSANSAAYSGGAIYNYADLGTSNPSISHSSFSSNTADRAGAIYNRGVNGTSSPSISQSSFSGNRARFGGGAIYNDSYSGTSSPTLDFVTLSGNSVNNQMAGGALYSVYGAKPKINHSILWGNSENGDSAGVFDDEATTSYTNSIVQGMSGDEFVSGEPLLGDLQDNGGPTLSMLPKSGSPAINAATACPADATDQRGVARPQGAACDLGAVERRPDVALSISVTGKGTVSGGAGACASSSSTCSADYDGEGGPASLVTLTASVAPGHTFAGWGGACSGTAPTCSVTMDQARSVTASFALIGSTDPGTGVQTSMGGAASCVFSASPTWAAPGAARAPLPANFDFPYGELSWSASGCTAGGTAVITVTLPNALPAGAQLFKWVAGAWISWPLTPVAGQQNAFTYSVTDNQSGDSDATAGAITDPALLAVPRAAPVAVPTLGEWGLMLLGLLMAGSVGVLGVRCQAKPNSSRPVGRSGGLR